MKELTKEDYDINFLNHEITHRLESEEVCTYTLRNPKTSFAWCQITATRNMISVIGDFNPVCFAYAHSKNARQAIFWIGKATSETYVVEKAQIGTGYHETILVSSPEKTKKNLKAWKKELQEEIEPEEDCELSPKEIQRNQNIIKAISKTLLMGEDCDGLPGVCKLYDNFMGFCKESIELEDFPFGNIINPSFHQAWAALRKLTFFLEKETDETPRSNDKNTRSWGEIQKILS